MKILRAIQKEPGDYVVLAAIAIMLALMLINLVAFIAGAVNDNYELMLLSGLIVIVCGICVARMLWAMEYVRKLREK